MNSISGIFLLYEGLPPTVIESQVLSHVFAMVEAGIEMEVWSFALKQKSYADARCSLPRLLRDFPITIRVFRGFSPWLPFSDRLNALLLLWWMRKLQARPLFIHARTERATAIAAIARKFRYFRLVWDARGDSLSELKVEVRQHYFAWRWLACLTKDKVISKRLKIAAQSCDAAIFVSEALRNLQGHSLPLERTLIVPCTADERLFYYSLELRAEVRSAFKYKNEDQVIIYVGSTAPWQCVSETTALMEQALRASPSFKALIVTPDVGAFEMTFSDELRDRIRLISGTLKDMNRFLNAADFGTLLRKQDAINWVASPVKFAEYSLAGLTVVTTTAVEQIIKIGEEIGNITQVDDFIDYEIRGNGRMKNRAEIAQCARTILGRTAYTKKLVSFYSSLSGITYEAEKLG